MPVDQSKALQHLDHARRLANHILGMPAETSVLPVGRVGILGAGTMGGGIAMNFLSAGIAVVIVEREQAALERGVDVIRRNYAASEQRGRLTLAQVTDALGLLQPTLELEDLAASDLIIEAVFENMDVKKDVFRSLDRIAKPSALLASNTSYLDIDEIARVTTRPQNVLGMHFFSPANIMKLLEVVRGERTSLTALATAMTLAARVGKTAVVSRVCKGFIGNRMLIPRQREAYKLVVEGASPWDVDRVLREFGFPMGPFQMTDLAGLDLGWSAETSRSSTLREVLCEAGRRGQKVGQGFYDYDEKRVGSRSAVVESIIAAFRAKSGVAARTIGDAEILERLLYPMINEAAQILAEGIAQRASDIDVVWTAGYGWPAHTGGPLFWADDLGIGTIVSTLQRHASRLGPDFTLSPLLATMAGTGANFLSGDEHAA